MLINMAYQSRVRLLWNYANALKPETHTHKLLKSYYTNMCRNFLKTVEVPKEKFAPTKMCTYCGCFWNESEFQLKLKPQRIAMKGKTKKLIDKLNKPREAGQKDALSGKQRKRAKWLQKRVRQLMEIKCKQCNHKSLIKMEKPKTTKKKPEKEIEVSIEDNVASAENKVNIKNKKKKKNKNKTAGLKIPQLESKPNKQNVNQQSSPATASKRPAANIETNPPQQLNKAKKKKKSGNSTSSTTANKVVLSKTQQQNSLLHLAALLKQQSSSAAANSGKSSAQKRLESLLK